jgi:uncharacterized protein (TIGR02001 family)
MSVRIWARGLIAAASAACAGLTAADDFATSPWTYNFGATTDYRFRGVSQSDNDPAMQGSVEYADPSGLFAGVWASTIDFTPFGDGDASVEFDLTAGFRHAFSDMTKGDLKVVFNWYPDSDPPPAVEDPDYIEFAAGLTHDFGDVSLSGELAYSPDFSRGLGDAFALTGGVGLPLTPSWWVFDMGIEASGHLGRQILEHANDYTYGDLGVSAHTGVFTVDLRYVDSSMGGCGDICDAGLVLSGSVAFSD